MDRQEPLNQTNIDKIGNDFVNRDKIEGSQYNAQTINISYVNADGTPKNVPNHCPAVQPSISPAAKLP